MFKMIGGMVVYGFALVGVVHGARWLSGQRTAARPVPSPKVEAKHREGPATDPLGRTGAD